MRGIKGYNGTNIVAGGVIMRLKNIYFEIVKYEEVILSIDAERVNPNSSSNMDMRIDLWNEKLNALQALHKIDCLKVIVDNIYAISPSLLSGTKSVELSNTQWQKLERTKNALKERMDAIKSLCESMEFGGNPEGFDVKLPVSRDFQEFVKHLNDFQLFLSRCPFIHDGDSRIELSKTDVGSFWLEFTFYASQTGALLLILAKVAKEAMKVKKMYLDCELQKQNIKSAKSKNELLGDIEKMYKRMIDAACESSVVELQGNIPLDEEQENDARTSLKTLAKLMADGLEIYSAIDAPEEIRDAFPTVEQQSLLQGPKKQIAEDAESRDEESEE